jgi:hypothetical protein
MQGPRGVPYLLMEEIILRPTITRSRFAAAAVAVSLAATGAISLATSAQAAPATYTVAPKSGPGGNNTGGQPASLAKVVTIKGTGTAFRTAGGTLKVGEVASVPSGTACSPTTTPFLDAAWSVPSAGSLVLTVPANRFALTATGSAPVVYSKKDYTLCVYALDATTLLGSGKYTVYPTPTITGPVSPVKGASTGGNTIAVDGTNFTAASVVKVGGVAATGVKVASDGKSLTAKVPAGTVGATTVTVTTEGGTNATPTTPTDDDYAYVNAISVSPPSGVGNLDTITVNGKGFDALNFALATVEVYLIQGPFVLANAGTYEVCGSVQVVSDSELVCQTDAAVADGAYTVQVVTDNTVVNSAATVSAISASATYTVADF